MDNREYHDIGLPEALGRGPFDPSELASCSGHRGGESVQEILACPASFVVLLSLERVQRTAECPPAVVDCGTALQLGPGSGLRPRFGTGPCLQNRAMRLIHIPAIWGQLEGR